MRKRCGWGEMGDWFGLVGACLVCVCLCGACGFLLEAGTKTADSGKTGCSLNSVDGLRFGLTVNEKL